MKLSHRVGSVLMLALAACSSEETREPNVATATSELTGIVGTNCAGAPPGGVAPDGVVHPIHSLIRYYYLQLQGAWTKVGGERVLQLWLPDLFEAISQEFYAWQAKSAQIFRTRDALAHAHHFYRGILGYLDEVDVEEDTCAPDPLTPEARDLGTLGHVATSQEGKCGKNPDNTDKYWKVDGLVIIPFGTVVAIADLIEAGVAEAVAYAPAERCLQPLAGPTPTEPMPTEPMPTEPTPTEPTPTEPTPTGPMALAGSTPGQIPCAAAISPDAVTEGLAFNVPSEAIVANLPLGSRPYTAAGLRSMPGELDLVRTFIRDPQRAAMNALGDPIFEPVFDPDLGEGYVRLVGHGVGPRVSPSSDLLDGEEGWVENLVGTYEGSCCRQECTVTTSLDVAGLVADNGGEPTCQTVCTPEDQCRTATLTEGVLVMVTAKTNKLCDTSCPQLATGAPSQAPTCEL